MSGLKDKAVKGAGWSAIDNIAKLGISFVVGIVLARLLSPDEYGLIGILTIFISVFNAVVDSGFTNALIRKKEAKDIDFCTVFYTNLVLSVFLAAVLFLCATPIADFFERPELVSLTKVMSVIVIINALAIVQKARLTKNIDFKTQTKVTILASIISGCIGVGLALADFGVWALVWQQISHSIVTTLFLWHFNKWVPKIQFSWYSFHDMWSFGWKLLVSSLIDITWREIYQVVIGKCYTPATLGLYTRAQQFASLCSSNLSGVVQRVSYPVLSTIQDDRPRLKDAYRRVIRTTMLPTFVLMIGMAAISKTFIYVLIGEKWLPCVPFLQIICFQMMLYPLHAINLNILKVQGRSDLFLRLEIIKKVIGVIPILLGIFINIYWMLIGSVFTGIFAYYLNAYYSGPYLNYSISKQVKDVLPSFLISLAMAVPVFLMSFIPLNPFILFPLQIIVGTAIVITICEKLNLSEYVEIKGIVKPMLKKITKQN